MKKTLLIFLLLSILSASGILIYQPYRSKKQNITNNTNQPEHIDTTSVQENLKQSARFGAVGDILIHDDIYEDFRVSNKTFDFTPLFIEIAPIIRKLDFAVLNQETILGGVDLGLSGLYVANSPQELGNAEIDAGFNIFQLTNNHAMDKGIAGLKKSMEYWGRQKDIITSGTYLSQKDRDTIPIIEKNGIKLAYLSYSYGSNLGNPPNSFQVNFIDKILIKKDVDKAKSLSDAVVVGLHWGVEKDRQPSKAQKDLANYLAEIGVDIIVGTHPHVLQPPEWIKTGNRKTLVMYSLGNFISIHTEFIPHTLTGVIMGVDIAKNSKGDIELSEPFAIPVWTYFDQNETGFRIIPFDQMNQSLYRYGNWSAHEAETRTFLKSKLPDLKILKTTDF